MGNYQALHTKTKGSSRSTRPSATSRSRCSGRYPLDPTLGSALVRSAGSISALSNLSPTLPGVGAWRCSQEDARVLGRGSPDSRQARPHRMLHRRNLRGGEKGGSCVGKTKRGKGTKLMAMADRSGIPLAVYATSASPHEVTLVYHTLKERFLRQKPLRLIGDRAYDSDPLDQSLAKEGIELIAPHKFCRVKPQTQDGRPLRRYRRRWKIERLFAWLHSFRRIHTRHDYYAENYLGFVHLGCILILLRSRF
jgi:transposase